MSMEVTSQIDLYDHEIEAADGALRKIADKQRRLVNLEGFRKEIIGRMAEVGLKVNVKVWTTDQPGLYAFDVDIVGRMEPIREFDYERQAHEVVNDLLGIDPSNKGETFKEPDVRATPSGIIIKGGH